MVRDIPLARSVILTSPKDPCMPDRGRRMRLRKPEVGLALPSYWGQPGPKDADWLYFAQ